MEDVGKDFMALKCTSGTKRFQVHLHLDGGFKLSVFQYISESLKSPPDLGTHTHRG